MRSIVGFLILTAFALAMGGCSSFYSQQSSFPSAATLMSDCSGGLAKTPPVRSNSCDLYNAVQAFCDGQGSLPVNAVAPCNAAGYATSGNWIKM